MVYDQSTLHSELEADGFAIERLFSAVEAYVRLEGKSVEHDRRLAKCNQDPVT